MTPIHPEMYSMPSLKEPQPVLAYAADRPAGCVTDLHTHTHGQLLHIVSGTLLVDTEAGTFVVPSERAVWVPGGVVHGSKTKSTTQMRNIYIRPDAGRALPESVNVVQVTPLLRELILTLMSWPRDYNLAGAEGRLADVLIDQISVLPVAPLHLPMPHSPRLRRIAGVLQDNPSDRRPLAEFAKAAALSPRTFERRFRGETGLTLRAWRQQAKLLKALELLADERPVNTVADELGYETPSAFIAVFRNAFGVSPGRYFAES